MRKGDYFTNLTTGKNYHVQMPQSHGCMEVSQIPYDRVETTSAKVVAVLVEWSCKEQISDGKSFLGILPQKALSKIFILFKMFRAKHQTFHRQETQRIVGFLQIQQVKNYFSCK